MNIGQPRRVIEVEPVTLPLPEGVPLPDLEPEIAPRQDPVPAPAEPEPEPEPEPAEPGR